MGKLQIDILGTSFAVQAKEDDAHLNKLLNYYKGILSAIQKSTNLKDPVQISILSGITLVDELYKYQKEKNAGHQTDDEIEAEALRITTDMIEKLTDALESSETKK